MLSEIIPGRLYLTSLQGANENRDNVDIIVTIMGVSRSFTDVHYEAEDEDDFDISQYFEDFYRLMEDNKDKKVLVHCYAGVSRSATLVASYILRISYDNISSKKNKKLELKHLNRIDFIEKLKKIRPVVSPNDGFIQKLKLYQRRLSDNYLEKETKNGKNL